MWLPAAGWNGKYMGTGNGGFAGSIGYASAIDNVSTLSSALLSGYAASATDTGHKGSATNAQWALGHPEKVVDYGYRAIHETAEKSKTIIRAFYGVAPKHSYFSSCSNGGREALMEAQRFPADYDGIIAGAPATSTNILAKFALDALATEVDPASHIPQAKLPAIDAATLAACDALDGLKDGIIDDPRKCNFDPSTLLCKSAETDSCLTQPQVAALKKIYAAATNSQGERIYPGFLPGAETAGWGSWITGDAPGKSAQYAFATQGSAYMLFQSPAWDFRTFNIDRDPKIADDTFGQRFNASSPDLKALDSRGGKLILYHGWSDPALSPLATIDYYQSVIAQSMIAKIGAKDAARFTRLYMVPGMQHCGGGPGPNNFGTPTVAALEQWVEQKKAPEAIIATHASNGKVDRIRPLCPYPQVAKYMGSGSIDETANFACRMP